MRAAVHRVLPVAALLLVLAAVTVWLVAGFGVLTPEKRAGYVAIEGVCWTLFAAAALLLRRVPAKAVPALVLVGTLLLSVAGATAQPTYSTDAARYSWDGIVQDAGISPYRYVPADPALDALRPDWLFPKGVTATDGTLTCPGTRVEPTPQVGSSEAICTIINRPLVPTIYPPVAEALFATARLAVPPTVGWLPMQVLAIVAVLATTLLLLKVLPTLGRDRRYAAVFGWSPFVAIEAVNNAHIDAVAAFLAVAATVLIVRRRHLAGGALLGLAIATKFTPLLVLPPLLRRRPLAIGGAAVGTLVLVYLPHVLAVGPAVIGYLPGYLNEEGYEGGTRSALLSWVLPDAASTPVAAALLAVLAVVLLLRTDPSDPWVAQTVMIGAALVLLSPRYPWYALLLLPFVVLSGRWEWLGVLLVLSVPSVQALLVFRPLFLAVVVIVAAVTVLRWRGGPLKLKGG